METLHMSNRQFKRMSKLCLSRTIYNTECELFIFNEKEGWNKEKKLLKKYYITSGDYFSNKLYTINALIDNKDKLNIDELVLPEKLFVLDKKVEGFTMPFVEKNVNLKLLLDSSQVSLKKKLEALNKIAHLLEKVTKLSQELNFYLGDIHEGNFIYDIDKQIFRVVDLDSCKIGNNNPSISKYLTFNFNLYDYPQKYPLDKDDIHISNKNTTILSFIYILLNTISKIDIHDLSKEEYYSYLQYLSENGVGKDLSDLFALIYTNSQNKFDIDCLEEIDLKKEKVLTYNTYKRGI